MNLRIPKSKELLTSCIKVMRYHLISTVVGLLFHSKGSFFFCEQGAEGNNLDLKGSKGSLDKIEKEEIRHVESPDDVKMCE